MYLAEIYSGIMYNDQSVEATSELKKQLTLLTESDYANYLVAFGSMKSGDIGQAKQFIDIALEKNPKNINYKRLKSEILSQTKKSQDSLKILKELENESINTVIFDKEIDFNSIISEIKLAYNYAEKLFKDIEYSYIALFFNPDLIAFVIIQLTRKKFFNNKYDKKIKHIYGYKLEDYKECQNEIKIFLDNVQNGLETSQYHKIPKNSNLE